MKQNVWEAKIPTVFALVLLLTGIVITSLLIQRGIITIGRASPDKTPLRIQTTNIADTSFSLVFTTNEKTQALASIGTNETELTELFYDERDSKTQKPQAYFSHQITFTNLKPNTKYFYVFSVEGITYPEDKKSFTITTAPSIQTLSTKTSINGKIIEKGGEPSSDTLVFLHVPEAQDLSVVSSSNGEYAFDFSRLRVTSLASIFQADSTTKLDLDFIKGNLSSKVTTAFLNAKEIPLVTLSNNFDFSYDEKIQQDSTDTTSSLKTVPVPSQKSQEIKIQFPLENAKLPDQKPQFKGTAKPNTNVKITIQSDNPQQSEVTTDATGQWSFRPTNPLTPGDHSITIETTDNSGIIKRITQKFTIFAEGSQVTESATPSATISPTKSVIRIPTPTPTTILSPTPTLSLFIVAPTPNIKTPTTTVLKPGNTSIALITSMISLILIVFGAILLFRF